MPKRIMVSGAISQFPLGGAGNTWAFLQYILGFRRLGLEVYYVEQLYAKDCVIDTGKPASFLSSSNVRYFRSVIDQFALADCAFLLHGDGAEYVGRPLSEVEKLAAEVDILINLSGRLQFAGVLAAVRRKLYVDLDPGYTQIWQEQYGADMNLRGQDGYATVGLNLGKPGCLLPTCGLRWNTTFPPVVLGEWETTVPPEEAYSTVADWRGFGPIEWQGVRYGQKADEFLRLIDLPRRVSVPLEICLLIHPDEPDRINLEQHGWRLTSPRIHAATPDNYRDYHFRARGEFTVVKPGYGNGWSGWFSDRSAAYLAAGRPVIVQDTGIGQYLPVGSGLLTFTDLASAAAAIEQVEQNYAYHAAAARVLAREYLDSDRVPSRLLQLAEI